MSAPGTPQIADWSIPKGNYRPEVESFYHLPGCSLAGKACTGTACFVARHLNPHRWGAAEGQNPRVYCLGQCFTAPAVVDGNSQRPRIEVRSREGIVLGRLANGGVSTLEAYTNMGGSLFEDNAEFGLGFRVSLDKQREFAPELLQRLSFQVGEQLAHRILQNQSR